MTWNFFFIGPTLIFLKRNQFTSSSRLEELFLCLNGYNTVSESQTSCPSLRLLQITDNQLKEWAEVRKLGQMYPSLKTLILANNSVDSVSDTRETLEQLFPNLRTINLNNSGLRGVMKAAHIFIYPCSIFSAWCELKTFCGPKTLILCYSGLSKWEDIERLAFFPKLEDVKAKGIPLLQPYTTHERRCLLLAQ